MSFKRQFHSLGRLISLALVLFGICIVTATAAAQDADLSIFVSPYMVETEAMRPVSAEWINLSAPENRSSSASGERSITASAALTATTTVADGVALTRTLEISRTGAVVGDAAANEILVPFVRFPTTAKAPLPPVFVLVGEDQTQLVSPATADRFLPLVALLLNTSDVVLVGQRGLESGFPYLSCADEQIFPLDEPSIEAEIAASQAQYGARCSTFWQATGTDTAGYNIAEAAADIDQLRRALGYEEIKLIGVDLGTQIGLEVLRSYEETIERALFPLVVGPNQLMKLPSDLQAHLEKIDARVKADAQLSAQIPDFLGLVESVLESLEGQSLTVTIDDPATGEPVPVTVGQLDLQFVTAMSQGGEAQKALPAHYYAMDHGDFTWLAEEALTRRRIGQQDLAPALANCASGATDERRVRVAQESTVTLTGDAVNGVRFDICDSIDASDIGDRRRLPVVSDVPVLFVSGNMDGHTPPSNADVLLSGLINGQHLVVDGGTHDLLDNALSDIGPIMRDFFLGDPLAPLTVTRVDVPYHFVPVSISPLEITGWRGEYFNNRSVESDPTLVRDDAEIRFNWGTGSPAPSINPDNFSARWTVSREVPAGTYRFSAWVDDGVRIWVDDILILDRWHEEGAARNYVVDVNVVSGLHTVRMEYFEAEGNALAQLSISRIDDYPGWKAAYFDNPDLAGLPVVVRNEPSIDYVWGDTPPVPGLSGGSYSVRWTNNQMFQEGAYRFDINVSGGGVRLWLDGQLLIEDWTEVSARTATASAVFNSAGAHELRVEYVYFRGNGAIRFTRWKVSASMSPPTAVISAPTYAQVGQSVPFDGNGSSAADGSALVSYAWDFGDGTSASGPVVGHVYTAAGLFNVTLTVTDANGMTDAATHQVRVDATVVTPQPSVAPVAIIRSPDQGMVGQAITFDARASTATNPVVRFDWQFGDGTSADAVIVQKIYGAPGVYNVTLTLTDDQGLQGETSKFVQIFAATPTPPSSAPSTPIPVNTPPPAPTMPPTATPVPAPPTAIPPQPESPLPPGSLPEGYILPKPVIVAQVDSIPQDPVDVNGQESINVLVGKAVTFDATASEQGTAAIASYNWTFGNEQTSTLLQVPVIYDQVGSYEVVLAVHDINNLVADTLLLVNVGTQP